MTEMGLKPIWVFDGKPPVNKDGTLALRVARKAKAENDLANAEKEGHQEDIVKFAQRAVRVTKKEKDACMRLLTAMGVPVLEAPSEAEATCAHLVKNKLADVAASEDMDTLTFGCDRLVRWLSSAKKDTVPTEINLKEVLKGFELSYDQFVDLCIMCGCD